MPQAETFFDHRYRLNDLFHAKCEKLYGRNDATPEALSASYAKRIASETMAFPFFRRVDESEKTVLCRLEKLYGRSNRPLYNVNPLSRLLDSNPMKSYSSPK
jgi:hypothetical protein